MEDIKLVFQKLNLENEFFVNQIAVSIQQSPAQIALLAYFFLFVCLT